MTSWSLNLKWLSISAVLLLALVTLATYLLHDHWDQQSYLHLADGPQLLVRHRGSEWHYFSGGHGFGFGGGGLRERLDFERSGKTFTWEGIYTPVSLQFDGEVPVVVVFDRESNIRDWGLRYYRLEGEWRELPLGEYPRQVAFLNMWHGGYHKLELCDPDDWHFRDSLSARFWLCIALKKTYREIEHEKVTPDFVREFKESITKAK